MYSLDVRVRRQSGLTQFPSDAALFHATEGDPEIAVVAAIDPDHARLDIPRYPMTAQGGIGGERCPCPRLCTPPAVPLRHRRWYGDISEVMNVSGGIGDCREEVAQPAV